MGSGVTTGPRGGTHGARGSNIPTPRYHRYRVTHAGSYCHTVMCFLQPTLFWAAKGDLVPHVGGAVSHRDHSRRLCTIYKYDLLVRTYFCLPLLYQTYHVASVVSSMLHSLIDSYFTKVSSVHCLEYIA